MPPSVPAALVACILVSALGALVMCLLVLRYGFTPVGDTEPARANRQLLATRLGHAVAGVCFAATAILAAVVVGQPAPPVAAPVPAPDPRTAAQLAALGRERQTVREQLAALSGTVQALRDQVGGLGGSVQAVRARLDRTEAGLKRLGDEVAQAQASARVRQTERPVATRPAVTAPAPSVRPATPPAEPARRAPAPELLAPLSESPAPQAMEMTAPGPSRSAPAQERITSR